jgi:hypothetical protein
MIENGSLKFAITSFLLVGKVLGKGVVRRKCCAVFLKRAYQPRNLRVRTLDAMAKARPSRPSPLTLQFLSGLARALLYSKKYSQAHWQYFCVELIHLLARLPLRLFLVYIK